MGIKQEIQIGIYNYTKDKKCFNEVGQTDKKKSNGQLAMNQGPKPHRSSEAPGVI